MTARSHPDPSLIALGIQQPWAELILRGIKTIEVRSQATQIRGPIYLYTSKRCSMFDAAIAASLQHGLKLETLPKGVLVGTVEIVASRPCMRQDAAAACVSPELLKDRQAWVLARPHRLPQPLEVRFLPYGVWFYPFQRRNAQAAHSPG
jgi:hypothetical protein